MNIEASVAKMFATPEGSKVDVLYATSRGKLYFTPEEATNEAQKTVDKVVTPYYRSSRIREMAELYPQLKTTLFAVDYIRDCKRRRMIPVHGQYRVKVKDVGIVSEGLFEFVRTKIYSTVSLIKPGQKDKIYMYNEGIVDAYLIRRYKEGIIWQVGDKIVLTCPAHTELMQGEFRTLFEPYLGLVEQ